MEGIEVGKTKHYELDTNDPLGHTYYEYVVTEIISEKIGLLEVFDGFVRKVIHISDLTKKKD
jgi:hypothetical protein